MKKKTIILCIMMSCFFLSKSQVPSPYLDRGVINLIQQVPQTTTYSKVGGYKVSGNPLFLGGYFVGEIFDDSNNLFNYNGSFGYDMYSQSLMAMDGKINTSKSVSFFKLKITDSLYCLFLNADSLNISKKGFVLELATGKNCNLYRYNYCTLSSDPNYLNTDYRTFESNYEYFIVYKTKEAKKLKMNKSSILKALGNSTELNKYADIQHINFDKDIDLVKLFNFINQN